MSWIDRRESKWKPRPKPDAEAIRRAEIELHEHRMTRLDAAKVAKAPVKAKDYLPQPVRQRDLDEELAKMANGRTDRWFLTCRQELLDAGLIETVLKEDGTWQGTRITAKGLARLGASATATGSSS